MRSVVAADGISPLPESASAILIVKGWDTSQAWFPGLDGCVKEMLIKYLQISSPMAATWSLIPMAMRSRSRCAAKVARVRWCSGSPGGLPGA